MVQVQEQVQEQVQVLEFVFGQQVSCRLGGVPP